MTSVTDELGGSGAPGGWVKDSDAELLVVDDDPRVLRLLVGRFGRVFKRVHLASGVKEADEAIRSHPISHIICDNDLSHPWATGLEVLIAWRREFIKIDRAVIYTGTSAQELGAVSEEIDAVVRKGEPLEMILAAFSYAGSSPPLPSAR